MQRPANINRIDYAQPQCAPIFVIITAHARCSGVLPDLLYPDGGGLQFNMQF